MVFTRATLLLGAALVLGSAQGALAADLGNYGGGSIKDGGYAMPVEASRPSIYLRFDGTYSTYDDPVVTEDHLFDLIGASIDSNWGYGGGVGMYFGHGFRGDLTVDHLSESTVTANLADPLADLPGVRKFGLSSTVALANLYYDFDMGNRFTPYIGAGLGFTRNETSSGTVTDPCGCLSGSIGGGSDTHVAGAAMAGFQIKLRERLSFDAGYRFLYLGEVATGPIKAKFTQNHNNFNAGDVVSQDPLVEDIHAHEFRLGLRYDIN